MATKLLLLEDVEVVGRKGDVVQVKDGYAYNFLIPQGYGMVATEAALRRQAKLQEERKRQAAQDLKDAEAVAAKIAGQTLTFTVKVDSEGHMYGSVTQLEIATALGALIAVEIEKKIIVLKHPIKATGVYEVPLKLKEGVASQVIVKVVAEEHPAAHETV